MSTPRALPKPDETLEPVYVWDLVVRVTHWTIFFSFVVLVITGIDIARPFLDMPAGKAGFTTGWIKIIHYYAAIAFSVAVFARLVWMFIGPRQSSWRQFVPVNPRRRRDLLGTLGFYMAIKSRPPPTIGHNPLAGMMYIAVFALYVLVTLTGFALYSVSAYTSYMKFWQFLLPYFGGPQGARWIHHVTMWLLIGFVVNHIFSAMLMSRVEKNGVFDSIISGWKYLPKDRKSDDAK